MRCGPHSTLIIFLQFSAGVKYTLAYETGINTNPED
jgi:hypothetical protein